MSLCCGQLSPKTTVSNWLSFTLARDEMPSIYTGLHQGFYSLCCKVGGFEKPLLVPQRHLHCARLVALLMIDASGRDVAERHIGDGIWAWRLLKASSAMMPMMMCMDITISTSDTRAYHSSTNCSFQNYDLYARDAR